MNRKNITFIIIVAIFMVTEILAMIFILHYNIKGNKMVEYYTKKCESFEVQNANLSKGQIIFIGDSITDLYPLDDYYTDLDKATYNRGIGGDVIDGVIGRLKVSLYDLAPSEVVLMIGINDLNGGRTAESLISRYEELLNLIKENLPETEVYVMSILSLNETLLNFGNFDLVGRINTIMQANIGIKELAENKGYMYMDLFSLTIDEENMLKSDLSDDGIHLNANGFEVWTNLIKGLL